MLQKTIALGIATTTALGIGILLTPKAQALSLTPGNAISLSGTTVAARPELAGTVVRDTLRTVGQIEVQDRVVREDGTGTLDFYYTIRNLNNFAVSLGSVVTHSSFANFLTDVDFRIDGLGSVAPLRASRSADGSVVSFDFGNLNLAANSQTNLFFIKTAALEFDELGQGGVDGVAFASYQPATAIPTPALLPGLIGLGVVAFRKRKAASVTPEV